MALRGTLEHPKTLTLADALGIMDCFALGVLEAFWHHVAKYHPDGDVSDLTPGVMARSIRYSGDPDALWAALKSAKFLVTEGDRTVVYGWSEHADDAIHSKLYRSVQRFADGSVPKPRSIGREERERLDKAWTEAGQTPDVRGMSDICKPDVLPVPEPVPEPNKGTLSSLKGSSPTAASAPPRQDEDWARFCAAYPKRSGDLGKAKGREKFLALVRSGTDPERIIDGARRYSEFEKAIGKWGTEFVKQIPTFLNGRAWEEDFDPPPTPVPRNGRPTLAELADANDRELERRENLRA